MIEISSSQYIIIDIDEDQSQTKKNHMQKFMLIMLYPIEYLNIILINLIIV